MVVALPANTNVLKRSVKLAGFATKGALKMSLCKQKKDTHRNEMLNSFYFTSSSIQCISFISLAQYKKKTLNVLKTQTNTVDIIT